MTLVGGKWTTYRACAKEIAENVLAHLGKPHVRSTLDMAIGGSIGLPDDEAGVTKLRDDIARRSHLGADKAAALLRRYGTRARDVADAIGAGGTRPLGDDGRYFEGEIRWIAGNERVTALSDIILRRTLLPFENGLSPKLIDEMSRIAASVLGWDEERRANEVRRTTRALVERFGVRSLDTAKSAGSG